MHQDKSISIAGCGWLGEPLAYRLAAAGHRVKGSATSPGKLERLGARGIEPYLLRLESLPECPADFFDSEVLMVLLPPREPALFQSLAERIAKSPVQKVLLAGSTSVYGPGSGLLTEDSPPEPGVQLAIETHFRQCPAFHCTVLRFGGLFGGGRHPGRWFAGRPLRDPAGVVNLIHRDDCIGIIETIIQRDIWGEVFNACAPVHPVRAQFYRRAAEALGLEAPLIPAAGAPEIREVSSEKLQRVLDYRFAHPDPMIAVERGD